MHPRILSLSATHKVIRMQRLFYVIPKPCDSDFTETSTNQLNDVAIYPKLLGLDVIEYHSIHSLHS